MAYFDRIGTMSSLRHRFEEGMHDMGHRAQESAAHALRRSRQSVRSTASSVEEFIEDQPVRSALLVVGVTCLLCAMFIRR